MDTLTASQVVVRNVTEIMSGETGHMIRISKSQLARELGWSRQRLSKLFSKSRISVDEVFALAVALRTSPARLMSPQREWGVTLCANPEVKTGTFSENDGPEWVLWGWSDTKQTSPHFLVGRRDLQAVHRS